MARRPFRSGYFSHDNNYAAGGRNCELDAPVSPDKRTIDLPSLSFPMRSYCVSVLLLSTRYRPTDDNRVDCTFAPSRIKTNRSIPFNCGTSVFMPAFSLKAIYAPPRRSITLSRDILIPLFRSSDFKRRSVTRRDISRALALEWELYDFSGILSKILRPENLLLLRK